MKRRKGEALLVIVTLLSILGTACSPNPEVLKAGKPSATPANVQNPQTPVDQEIENARTADFRYIWIIRRKDGGVLNAADKAIIRPNTADMNRRVLTDDEKAVVLGSNTVPFKENLDALTKAFDVQDVSTEPVPSPLPTREPTPKGPKVIR